jgi:hypothetical protein
MVAKGEFELILNYHSVSQQQLCNNNENKQEIHTLKRRCKFDKARLNWVLQSAVTKSQFSALQAI